jgi:hypothetical protein
MLGLYAIFKTLLVIIWIIDILNIDFIINGIHVAEFLDVTVPLNGWFWLLVWLLVPTVTGLNKKED